MSLAAAISAYINNRQEFREHNQMLEHYTGLSYDQAVDDAVFGRHVGENGLQYISNHYWRAYELKNMNQREQWPEQLYEARKRLLSIRSIIEAQTNFESLYTIIRRELEVPKIRNLGSLYYYDVALRIGFALSPIVLPNQLFVQSGSERGAKDILGSEMIDALKNGGPFINPIHLYETENAFRNLEVHQIESFLCVMKDEIKEWRNTQRLQDR